MRPSLLLPLALAGALVSSTAAADASTEVHLRDGSIFRGELVEKVVGDHITIKLATGETRMIRWADLAPEDTAPRGPGGAPVDPSKLEVEVTSTGDTVQLQRQSGIGEGAGYVGGRAVAISVVHYEPICEAPCTSRVDPQATYRIAGNGITPSNEFTMRQGESPLRLRVSPGSASARGWGWISTTSGISFVGLGALTMALLGSAPDPNDTKYRFSSGTQDLQADADRAQTFRTIGIAAIATGAVLTVTGIVLIATNGTSVKTESGRAIGTATPPARPKLTAAGLVF